MKTRARAPEEVSFGDVAALIEREKAEALAAFDPQAFRTAVLSRLESRSRGWTGSLRLVAAAGLALLLATWAALAPEPSAARRSLELRLVERALLRGTALRAAGSARTPVESARSNDVWAIERALLTWRRQQGGSVDVERALCSASLPGGPRSCSWHEAREVAAPGARRRLERALTELERDGTIHRALVGRRRT